MSITGGNEMTYSPKHAAPYNWAWEKDLWKFELALHGPHIPRGRHAA